MPGDYPTAGDARAARCRRTDDLRELRPVSLLAGLRLTAIEDVVLYTDGACSGNPGAGGWAAIIQDGEAERALSGADVRTTNQRMELTAAIEGLAAIPGRRTVHLYTDSAYVMNCFRDRWWERWERSGWVGAGRQPVANRDLWERLLAETRRHDVHWHKVKGHSGDLMNDRVDKLARAAIATASP